MILRLPTSYLRNGMARNSMFVYTLPAISKTTLSGSSWLKIKDADREEVCKIFNL